MKKRFTGILLSMCMVLSTTAFAETALIAATNIAKSATDSDITWIGSTNDYAKTLSAFFDNGLRKVAVGINDKKNNLTQVKYGLMDKNGEWKTQPVYDKIEAYYWNKDNRMKRIMSTDQEKYTETIFVNGYVQVKRNGKMGLLDINGKEVIPCEYTAVGLPSEGMCRLVNGGYIGYWNLKSGREVVAPDKYKIIHNNYASAEGGFWLGGGDQIAFDFRNGYALVNTGKTEEVTIKAYSGLYGKTKTYTENESGARKFTLVYAQIIDKNGKEILPTAYPYLEGTSYPQDGAYLAYSEVAKEMLQMKSDADDDIMFGTHLDTGIAGAEGVVVPAQYNGAIVGNAATGWHLQPANLQIFSSVKAFITFKSPHTGLKEGGAPIGAVSLSNKTIVPFKGGNGTTFNGGLFEAADGIYKPDGSIIKDTATKHTDIKKGKVYTGYVSVYRSKVANGYTLISRQELTYNYSGDGDIKKNTLQSVVDLKNNKSYNINIEYGKELSEVSNEGTFWINKDKSTWGKSPEWGMVNLQGKIILPFGYEGINYSEASYPFTTVKKNGKWGVVDKSGKQLLPCQYSDIDMLKTEGSDSIYLVIVDENKKNGIYSLSEKKITVPCKYGPNLSRGAAVDTVLAIAEGTNRLLVDLATGTESTDSVLFTTEPLRGLYYQTVYAKEVYGPDGKVVFPTGINSETMTLVVKGNRVGSISASYLAGLSETSMPGITSKTAEPGYSINEKPYKVEYYVGDFFEYRGILVIEHTPDGKRHSVENSKLKFYSDNVDITKSGKLRNRGKKVIEVRYNGKAIGKFTITVK